MLLRIVYASSDPNKSWRFPVRDATRGLKIPLGGDRFGRSRSVFGVMPFTVKVSSHDSDGTALVIEQANAYRGGPPRHVHHDQEEWFYVVEGEYVVSIGEETYPLLPGDSVLAPRGVPHAWALVGHTPGRMVIAFFPAGRMEEFFDEAVTLDGQPSVAAARSLFAAYGMDVTGSPIDVE